MGGCSLNMTTTKDITDPEMGIEKGVVYSNLEGKNP